MNNPKSVEDALSRLKAIDVSSGPVDHHLEARLKRELRSSSRLRKPLAMTLLGFVACTAFAGIAYAATGSSWTLLYEWIQPNGEKIERRFEVGPGEAIIPDHFGPNGEGGPRKVKLPPNWEIYDPDKHGGFERPLNQSSTDDNGFTPVRNRAGEVIGRERMSVEKPASEKR